MVLKELIKSPACTSARPPHALPGAVKPCPHLRHHRCSPAKTLRRPRRRHYCNKETRRWPGGGSHGLGRAGSAASMQRCRTWLFLGRAVRVGGRCWRCFRLVRQRERRHHLAYYGCVCVHMCVCARADKMLITRARGSPKCTAVALTECGMHRLMCAESAVTWPSRRLSSRVVCVCVSRCVCVCVCVSHGASAVLWCSPAKPLPYIPLSGK